MTREFNQNQRYDSRPPYRGSSSNNRYGAEQPSGPTRPRLNRAMVDRAWENGAPHRHADYKPRHPNEAGTNQTNHGPNSQRNWRKAQPSGHPTHDNSFQQRGDSTRPSRYDSRAQQNRSDSPPNGYQGSRPRSAQPNNSFADQPPYRDQRGNGNEENTYRARNGHPNFSQRPQDGNRGRYNQEPGRQESHLNGAYSYRTNPTNRVNNGVEDRRDQHTHPYNRRDASYHNNRFEGRQRPYSNQPRYPSYPTTPSGQREKRSYQQAEQFEGDYEQFNHAPSRQPGDGRRQEEPPLQPQTKRTGKPPEVERHVTPLPDGRVLKGPRPAQRKNAQFWTEISQDTEKLIDQVQAPEAAAETIPDEQAQTSASPATQSVPATRVISSRTKAAKRAGSSVRKDKTDKPVSSGPRPSQRGFKWPASPSQS